ncbi:MAG: DUF11 domain-containing protein [Gammaproteobacteria bacterium]|nr:DUF11 domain-containing protein [Gammaproteobacteria bacterium]
MKARTTRFADSSRLLLISLLCLSGLSHQALAVGTAAGSDVDNIATINYSVGGVAQTAIESSPTGNSTPGASNGTVTRFVVDNMVDVTVTEVSGSYTDAAPAETQVVLEYTVANTGNATQDYILTTANGADPFGGTDSFNPTSVQVFVESGATAGFQPAQDTAVFIDELAADATQTVYVVATMPGTGTVSDGDIAAITLTAQTAQSGSVGVQGSVLTDSSGIADNPSTVEVVFADDNTGVRANSTDGVRDGASSDTDAYRILAADLTVTKTSAVISDPFNGTTNPKAIPGAVVEYTITIANAAGAATATSIVVTDAIPGAVTFVPAAYTTGGIRVTAPNINAGATKTLTNGTGDDEGDFNGTNANAVTVTGISLTASQSATVTFRVEIQ